MSLYQNLINESLEEDIKINREVFTRLKKNYKDNKETLLENQNIDETALLILKKYFSTFERELFLIINNIEKGFNDQFYNNIIDIVNAYNNICIYLSKISYNKMNPNDKNGIIQKFKTFISPLNLIETQLKANVTDEVIIPIIEIKTNIQYTIFQPVGYALEKYVAKEETAQKVLAREAVEQQSREDLENFVESMTLQQINDLKVPDLNRFSEIAKNLGFTGKNNISQVKLFLRRVKQKLTPTPPKTKK